MAYRRMKYCLFAMTGLAFALVILIQHPATAQIYLPQLGGGGGGQFADPCPAGQFLSGVILRTGDDVDGLQAACGTPAGLADMPPGGEYLAFHGGDGGPNVQRLLCPVATPVILGIGVGWQGEQTNIVHDISIYCGRVDYTPQPATYPSGVFAGYAGPHSGFFIPQSGFEQCPTGQVASGIHGHSGKWLDAIGLICAIPPAWGPALPPTPPPPPRLQSRDADTSRSQNADGIGAMRPRAPSSTSVVPERASLGDTRGKVGFARVEVPGAPIPPAPRPPICLAAENARARLSPAAPNLERQCLAAGGHLTPIGQH